MARWSRFLGSYSRDGRQQRPTRRRSDDVLSDAAVILDDPEPPSAAVGSGHSGMGTAVRRLGVVGLALTMVALAGTLVRVAPAVAGGRGAPAIEGLFDVGGYRLYLRCTGRGTPTVVMDHSLGEGGDSTTWSAVEPSIARHTRVCVYDRAGVGLSDPGPVPRTSQLMIDDLTTLLRVADIPGPYVVVAHSLAGLNAQLLARQDGGHKVVGVVLIDTLPPELIAIFDELGIPIPPPEDRVENPEGIDIRVSAAQVLAAPPFPPVPLLVLRRGIPSGDPFLDDLWQELQLAQSQLSPAGRLIVARRSGHFIQIDQPKLVVRAIVEVVARARHNVAPGHAVNTAA
jgi:pimeloyl-ACP methyl ester carboxylesterase